MMHLPPAGLLTGLFVVWSLLAPDPTASPPAAPSGEPADTLTTRQQVLHALDRLAYGPRPGDVERVRAMGLDAWIERQLHPEAIESPVLQEKLAHYRLPEGSWEAMVQHDRPAVARAQRQRRSVLERAEARKESPVGSDVSPRERLRVHVRNGLLPADITRMDRRYEDFEYLISLFWRAVYSEAQLEQVMVDFWFNHFNIQSGDPFIHADYGENVIRKHAFGNFHDLLVATARHPGMLVYLDNWLSAAPDSVVERRLASWTPPEGGSRVLALRSRAEFLEQASGLNENYGRELMELHTVGVDGGYTQTDVEEVARAFTGWTLEGGEESGRFVFDPLLHVEGDKVVMGETIPSGGMDEGMRILDMLAHHPSTARYISTKLVRRFVADDPPPAIVDVAAARFLESDGDLRETLRAIFQHPDFFAPEHYRAKIKKPLEVVASGMRAVGAEIRTDFLGPGLNQVTEEMGEPLRNHEAPDGYPDVAEAWMSSNALFKRLRFAMDVATESLPGLEVPVDEAVAHLRALGYAEPTEEQIAQARDLFANMQREAMSGGGMMMEEEEMGGGQAEMMGGGPPGEEAELEREPVDYESVEAKVVALALMLGSPEFQKR